MKIQDYLNDEELYDLALYLKRVDFENVYEHSEGSGEERKENAYKTLDVIAKLQTCLKDMGFNPR